VPIRTRVVLVYVLIMGIVLTGASVFLLARLRGQLWHTIDTGLRTRAAVLAGDTVEDRHQLGTSDPIIDEAEAIAQVVDRDGRVLESTDAIGPEPLLARADIATLGRERGYDTEVSVRGERHAMRVFAVRSDNGLIAVIGTSVDESHEAIAALSRLLGVGGPVVLVLTAVAVWALTGVALRPVERLRSEAEALSFGMDTRRLPVPGSDDEIARLAETLNHMLERLETSMERERRFVDDASHELRTPLAVLKTELELALRRARSRDELEATIRSAAEEVDGLARLTEHLLVLARADRGLLATRPTRVDVAQLVEHVGEGFRQRAVDHHVQLRTDAPEPVWAEVDPLLVRQAVANLIENALGHTPSGGTVSVAVSGAGTGTRIVVDDSGPGFDSSLLPTVFEPFTRSDGARGRPSGTGLGLAIVRAIAEAHGGGAEARNRPDGGASVSVVLTSS
jgi:two-component system, OmpR family, sensor kinase